MKRPKKKITPTQLYLFQAMLDGKAFRLSEEGKKFWSDNGLQQIPQWFNIVSIDTNMEMVLQNSTGHDIYSGVPVKHLKNFEHVTNLI